LAQQPDGQLVASHVQVPPTQCWPAAQALPEPQRHWALAQPSAPTPHDLHAAPPVPQDDADGVMQVVPEQQPFGQVDALQVAEQVSVEL
jgi:hypothetical protein